MLQRKKLTCEQAFQHAKIYCSYQERSHRETKEKLYSFGLTRIDIEHILSRLVEEDYLNEERYAAAYARGKFRIKQWGRIKIKYELKQKQVSDYCIKNAMKEIDEEEYMKTLGKLMEEKLIELESEKNVFVKRKKATDYLLQKGYERDFIYALFKE
jgi:regulatory protein